jgi:hypothetical protein
MTTPAEVQMVGIEVGDSKAMSEKEAADAAHGASKV